MENSRLYSIPKKKLGTVCVELTGTKVVKRMNWLKANELVNNNQAKFVSKSVYKEYVGKGKDTKAVDVTVEDKPSKEPRKKLKAKEIRAKNKKVKN